VKVVTNEDPRGGGGVGRPGIQNRRRKYEVGECCEPDTVMVVGYWVTSDEGERMDTDPGRQAVGRSRYSPVPLYARELEGKES
jgi:hypothetical protein